MATKRSFDEKDLGALEDLSSFITKVAIEDDELWIQHNMNNARRRATQRTHQYLADNHRAAAANAFIEGWQIGSAGGERDPAQTARVRLTNEVQTFTEAIELTDNVILSQDLQGIQDELEYQKNKKALDMAKDKELQWIVGTLTTGAAGTAGELSGFLEQADGVNIRGVAMDDGGGVGAELRAVQTRAQAGAVTEVVIQQIMENARRNGKKLEVALFTFDNAQTFANLFASQRELMPNTVDVTQAIMIYRSYHGILKIIPHIYMSVSTIFAYNTDMVAEALHTDFRIFQEGKSGSRETWGLEEETTLEHLQPDTYQEITTVT